VQFRYSTEHGGLFICPLHFSLVRKYLGTLDAMNVK